ncbi:MAG: hypothetical protein ACYC5M_14730 [Anaerolineae bacterium]
MPKVTFESLLARVQAGQPVEVCPLDDDSPPGSFHVWWRVKGLGIVKVRYVQGAALFVRARGHTYDRPIEKAKLLKDD